MERSHPGTSRWITSQGEENYRTAIDGVRVGNAVVADLTSDEELAADVVDLATVNGESLADVVGAMNELQSGPSGPTPDLSDPATTRMIPGGFPSDPALGEPPVEDSEATIDWACS